MEWRLQNINLKQSVHHWQLGIPDAVVVIIHQDYRANIARMTSYVVLDQAEASACWDPHWKAPQTIMLSLLTHHLASSAAQTQKYVKLSCSNLLHIPETEFPQTQQQNGLG
ncbi:hypothetical protein DUNSADRAFT_3913 [Dunaliella salina]|uniref:Uncharacterized protein n=1 Tax=Dunaliella salina TaxID=3046 RepID=A0ABQ7GT39_DUNSA|nr:hypothetical protein DUNSADRAFT_3913 [Dunaliella salina]|eukprot:KAF5837770.1 hypothetical protein DUNSADRAFT_3913 [Dunaliella salina]